MRVIWTPQAEQDRGDIWDVIVAENPDAAIRLDLSFSAAAAYLEDHPEMGRKGVIPGARELFPHENYRLVYEIADGMVWVLALVHTARLWPPVR